MSQIKLLLDVIADIRSRLAEISRDGHTNEVKLLITKYGLNNFQKLCDGEPLGGKSRAEDDFADFDDDDDDFLS